MIQGHKQSKRMTVALTKVVAARVGKVSEKNWAEVADYLDGVQQRERRI